MAPGRRRLADIPNRTYSIYVFPRDGQIGGSQDILRPGVSLVELSKFMKVSMFSRVTLRHAHRVAQDHGIPVPHGRGTIENFRAAIEAHRNRLWTEGLRATRST